MKTYFRYIITILIFIFGFTLCSYADGAISFAVTDGEKSVGVWTHTGDHKDLLVKYVNSSRLGTTTVFIQGRMTSFEASYRQSYYFEYVLQDDEQFEIDTLSDFIIDPENIGLTTGHSTTMKMRFYLDGTDEYVDIDSTALYNKSHLFENTVTSARTVTKIRYWPVYDIYNAKGNLLDDVKITVSGVIASESLVSFRFLDTSETVNLTDTMPDTEFEYTTNSGVLKSYTGTGLIGNSPKYSVSLIKERYETPILSFTKNCSGYSVSVDNFVDGAIYSYSVSGGEYSETSDGTFPIINPDDVIFVKTLKDEGFSQSLECVATPVVNAYSMSMIFDGGITFKVFLVSSVYSEFTVFVDGNKVEVQGDDSGYYVLCRVAPKDLLDKVFNIKIVSGDFVVENSYKSIDYVEKYLEYSEKLRPFISSLADYSRSAKDYFLGTSDIDYANADHDEEIKKLSISEASENMPEGIQIYSSALILEDKITIRHYFSLKSGYDINLYSFTCENKQLIPHENNGYYFVDISNISILSLADSYTLYVESNTSSEEGYVIYSVGSYMSAVVNEATDESLLSLIRYLYLYYKSSLEYKGL